MLYFSIFSHSHFNVLLPIIQKLKFYLHYFVVGQYPLVRWPLEWNVCAGAIAMDTYLPTYLHADGGHNTHTQLYICSVFGVHVHTMHKYSQNGT